MTATMKTAYNRVKWALILRGLLGIALGVFILARPLTSVAAFALVIAIWAIVEGVVNVVHAFDLRPVFTHWWVLLLSGIVSFLFGAAALYYYPILSLAFAVVWAAWWLISLGVLGIYFAIQERKAGVSSGWTMLLGIVTLVIGVLALVYPGITLVTLMSMLAAFGIVGGIIALIGAGRMQSFGREMDRAVQTPSHA